MQAGQQRPRVLIFSTLTVHEWGGSEKYWYDAVRSPVVVDGLDVRIVISRSRMAEDRCGALLALGHTVTWRGAVDRMSTRRRLGRAALRRLGREPTDLEEEEWRGWLDEHRPDLLVFAISSTVWYSALTAPVALARTRRIPYWIIVQHSSEHFFPQDDQQVDAFRAIFAGARRVVFIADRNRLSVERVMGEALPNAWMGTNTLSAEFIRAAAALIPSADRAPPAVPTLLNLARFEPDVKGQHILLAALAGLGWKERVWQLVLAGGGRHAATLMRLIRYYGLDERVEVLEHRDDVLSVIASADLIVMPSLSEGTPYALLEAMAAGLPAVGTPVGGIPDVVLDGRTGWLAAAAEVSPLSEALDRAWTDMSDWPAFGRRAAELIASRHCAEQALPPLGAALRNDAARVRGHS
jgi:glycosyltransferase involved in cell wall biosynthesis